MCSIRNRPRSSSQADLKMPSSNTLSQGEGIATPILQRAAAPGLQGRRPVQPIRSDQSAVPHILGGEPVVRLFTPRSKAKAMARPLRLALILLLMCAGVVVAAPIVTNSDQPKPSSVAAATPKPVLNDFILWVDARSGCVWRVSETTGQRELDPLPCKRPKNRTKSARS